MVHLKPKLTYMNKKELLLKGKDYEQQKKELIETLKKIVSDYNSIVSSVKGTILRIETFPRRDGGIETYIFERTLVVS